MGDNPSKRAFEKLGYIKNRKTTQNQTIGLAMRVLQAKYIGEYKINILFSDGICKMIDFAPFLKTAKHVFIPLKDIEYFKKFNVDDITLSWPNDADFDPELLYEMGIEEEKQSEEKLARKTVRKTRSSSSSSMNARTRKRKKVAPTSTKSKVNVIGKSKH